MNKQNGYDTVLMRSLFWGWVLIGFMGCSAMHAERDMARLVGAYQTKIKSDMDTFAASRDLLAEARHHNVDFLEQSATVTENENSTSLVAWRIAEDKQRLGLHDGIRGAVQEQITKTPSATALLEEPRQISAEIRAAVKARADKLGESAKVLSQLAEPKDLRSEIDFYLDFSRQVGEVIQKQQEEAKKKAEEGEKKAMAAAETAKNTVSTMGKQKQDAKDAAEQAKKNKSQ